MPLGQVTRWVWRKAGTFAAGGLAIREFGLSRSGFWQMRDSRRVIVGVQDRLSFLYWTPDEDRVSSFNRYGAE